MDYGPWKIYYWTDRQTDAQIDRTDLIGPPERFSGTNYKVDWIDEIYSL
jgi:hypothetical protein